LAGKAIDSVLFLCGRNAVRSPIAHALTENLYPGRFRTASAGIAPGDRDPFVDAVLAEMGISLGEHRPSGLDALAGFDFDLAVTLSPQAHHRALELTREHPIAVEYWPTPDPTGAFGSREQILFAYRELRDHLAARLRQRFGEPDGPSAGS
jgi:protein-tyrosine-phosphatase